MAMRIMSHLVLFLELDYSNLANAPIVQCPNGPMPMPILTNQSIDSFDCSD